MIDTLNKSKYNIWLTDEVSFEFWYGKIVEFEISKKDCRIYSQIISQFFSWNVMRVIRLRLQLIAVNLTKVGTK